jgi:hypothetical protein
MTMDAIRWAFGMVALIGLGGYSFSLLYRMTLTEEELGRELLGESVQQKEILRIWLGDVQALHSWAIHNGLLAFLATFALMVLVIVLIAA